MIELLCHEMTHAWVLPCTEPIWNESIATYIGIRTAQDLGYNVEGSQALARYIDDARRYDPNMNTFNPGHEETPHEVIMGKPMWIFEQLREDDPNFLSKYFQSKRAFIDRYKITDYSASDSIAVLSIAMDQDLFQWFCSMGIPVSSDESFIWKQRYSQVTPSTPGITQRKCHETSQS